MSVTHRARLESGAIQPACSGQHRRGVTTMMEFHPVVIARSAARHAGSARTGCPSGPGLETCDAPRVTLLPGAGIDPARGFPADFEADSGSDAAGAPRQLSCVRNGLQSVRGCRSDAIRRGRPTGTRREHGESPRPVVGVHPPDAPTWDVRHRATERTQCKPSPPDPRPSPWHGDMLDAALRRTRR
jgi:hypothetical protein